MIPNIDKEYLEKDQDRENNLLEQAIHKEMENVRVDFEKISHTLDEIMNGKCLPGFQDIGCIMIFDININEIFNGKARLVSGGHTTEPPTSTTYSSFISRDSVRVVFMLAAINDIDVYAAKIGNIYLNVTCWEYISTIAG